MVNVGYAVGALQNLGYTVSKHRQKRLLLRKPPKKRGRPSKVKDAHCQQLVLSALNNHSHDSSWTMVHKNESGVRERRQVRCLSANPTTIYRACSEVQAAMRFTQFRRIHRLVYPQYKRGRLKTDMCDHCENFRLKITPRVQQFIARMWAELLELALAGTESKERSSPFLPEQRL